MKRVLSIPRPEVVFTVDELKEWLKKHFVELIDRADGSETQMIFASLWAGFSVRTLFEATFTKKDWSSNGYPEGANLLAIEADECPDDLKTEEIRQELISLH